MLEPHVDYRLMDHFTICRGRQLAHLYILHMSYNCWNSETVMIIAEFPSVADLEI